MPKHLTVASAGATELSPTSESEEMYLITVARAIESGQAEPIPMPLIAEVLTVSVASANEMVRKLAGRGLVTYEPYHGAGLTESGRAVANRVLRTRRLWATFLADHLGFPPIDADDQACHLEHATAADAADRLATFLGHPTTDPMGRPIPTANAHATKPTGSTTLDEVSVGSDAEVVAVRAPGAANAFLTGEGISVGARLAVIATGESGVLVDSGTLLNLSRLLAATVDVRVVGRSGGA